MYIYIDRLDILLEIRIPIPINNNNTLLRNRRYYVTMIVTTLLAVMMGIVL